MSIQLKLEKDLCRCCHAEGSFCNLAEPKLFMGQQEVYSEMLQQSLNIEISPVTDLFCSESFTICDQCILRLRDAHNFKQQVVKCEERFKDMCRNILKDSNSDYELKTESVDEIKIEVTEDDDDMFDTKLDDDEDDEDDNKTVQELQLDAKKKCKSKPEPKPKAKRGSKIITRSKKNEEKNEEEAVLDGQSSKEQPKNKGQQQYILTYAEDGTIDYNCKTCGRIYKSRKNFSQHYNHVHLKQRPKFRGCHLCDVKVPGYLRRFHLEEAHDIPAPKCFVCNKTFPYPHLVLKHQKIYHMGEKDFECKVCEMKFEYASKLRRHEVKHTGIRNFECEICGKTYIWSNNLRSHMLSHRNERRHVCTICDKAFLQQSSLTYHLKKRHPDCV